MHYAGLTISPSGVLYAGVLGGTVGIAGPLMPEHALVFIGIVALLTITPGRRHGDGGAQRVHGRAPGGASRPRSGSRAGCFAWACASALGVAAVLAASQTAYDALRLVGAVYLIWLGRAEPAGGAQRARPGAGRRCPPGATRSARAC